MSCQDNRDNSSVSSGTVNRRRILLASTTLGVASALGSLAHVTRARAQTAQGGAATPITEQEAHAIGVDAYLYFYPLVTMDLTRKQETSSSHQRTCFCFSSFDLDQIQGRGGRTIFK